MSLSTLLFPTMGVYSRHQRCPSQVSHLALNVFTQHSALASHPGPRLAGISSVPLLAASSNPVCCCPMTCSGILHRQRRKQKQKQPHGNLLNLIDSSADVSRSVLKLAQKQSAAFEDLELFARDPRDHDGDNVEVGARWNVHPSHSHKSPPRYSE